MSNHPSSGEVIHVELPTLLLCVIGVTLQTDGQRLDWWRHAGVISAAAAQQMVTQLCLMETFGVYSSNPSFHCLLCPSVWTAVNLVSTLSHTRMLTCGRGVLVNDNLSYTHAVKNLNITQTQSKSQTQNKTHTKTRPETLIHDLWAAKQETTILKRQINKDTIHNTIWRNVCKKIPPQSHTWFSAISVQHTQLKEHIH